MICLASAPFLLVNSISPLDLRTNPKLIYDNWNTLPQDALDSTVNISNVPKKLQKRYNRALKVHGDRLARADAEWMRLNAPHYSNQKEHALSMLEDMQKHLPNHGAKMISDLPLDSFRGGTAQKRRGLQLSGIGSIIEWRTFSIPSTNRPRPFDTSTKACLCFRR